MLKMWAGILQCLSVRHFQGRGLPHKKDGGACIIYRVKREVLVPLSVFSLKKSLAGTFVAPRRKK